MYMTSPIKWLLDSTDNLNSDLRRRTIRFLHSVATGWFSKLFSSVRPQLTVKPNIIILVCGWFRFFIINGEVCFLKWERKQCTRRTQLKKRVWFTFCFNNSMSKIIYSLLCHNAGEIDCHFILQFFFLLSEIHLHFSINELILVHWLKWT